MARLPDFFFTELNDWRGPTSVSHSRFLQPGACVFVNVCILLAGHPHPPFWRCSLPGGHAFSKRGLCVADLNYERVLGFVELGAEYIYRHLLDRVVPAKVNSNPWELLQCHASVTPPCLLWWPVAYALLKFLHPTVLDVFE